LSSGICMIMRFISVFTVQSLLPKTHQLHSLLPSA
jgi:hypothetical protein